MSEYNYSGLTAMITGAGSGIGRNLSLAYAREGAQVILIDRHKEGLQETQDLLKQHGLVSDIYVVDVSQPQEIEELFRELERQERKLDILINNAGFGIFKPMHELTLDEWDSVINTNLRGTFLCSREAAVLMRRHGGGSIVNMSSTRAGMSEPNSESYAASKGGILSLTHALALSLGPDHIMVNAVSPGWIETGDYRALREEDHAQHPAGRVGRTEDIARACLYLTHPANDFVTGANLVVDGGMTRKMIYVED
ncbi:SDR family oxidoreductase [Paenibacillus sp. JX-17]|uniref:SDR family oxidoreductase n=1 Tax=Paenibacillus lacisoli TaxID=3064525 RepID=A0ABT9C8S1_9BACL|nr:SDR family oxidoreductase [Paenibacillus sp. JX-17]MDO7905658.1 SDR family oxidoreductase [Paenibacillus sp. JX-17]